MRYLGSAFFGLAALVALTGPASAAVVCNEWGDCWKVKERPTYPAGVNLQFYDDDWTWAETDRAKFRWREPRNERGYWGRDGVWIDF